MIEHRPLTLAMGKQLLALGQLDHFHGGLRAYSQFCYAPAWLERPKAFSVSPDLPLLPGPHIRKPTGPSDPSVFLALADTAPGPWARRVIEFDHQMARESNPRLGPLDELQYLRAVNDAHRWGAIRLVNEAPLPSWHRAPEPQATLEDLTQAVATSWIVGRQQVPQADLRFLMTHATSMGGAAPKACVLDETGRLAVLKLPPPAPKSDALKLELLALTMAREAGIEVPAARMVFNPKSNALLIERFDRTEDGGRKACISARTLLQVRPKEVLGYLDLLRAMPYCCTDAQRDARQLWRRLVFWQLIGHADKDLQRIHFRYDGQGRWSLAPAVGLTPHPETATPSGLPLSAQLGKITSIQMLLDHAPAFALSHDQARGVLAQVVHVVRRWRIIAESEGIRFPHDRLDEIQPLFENTRLATAMKLCG
jgi:serine/threonine-protein kinase HipA